MAADAGHKKARRASFVSFFIYLFFKRLPHSHHEFLRVFDLIIITIGW